MERIRDNQILLSGGNAMVIDKNGEEVEWRSNLGRVSEDGTISPLIDCQQCGKFREHRDIKTTMRYIRPNPERVQSHLESLSIAV